MRYTGIIGIALTTALAGGCVGDIVNSGGEEAAAQVPLFPRLSHVQWENTVQDLFGFSEPVGLAQGFDNDPPLGRFDNNVARLRVTSGLWQDYQRAAETVAEMVTADQAALDRIIPADLPADPDAAARAFITAFGARAFRRPLTATEVDRYAALFAQGPAHFEGPDTFVDGVRITLEGMLQSPHFVYRVESNDGEVENGLIELDGYQVASRLSYLFWNTMPDDQLFQAAAAGDLDSVEGVRAQALRMFDDPRTRATFAHFHYQLFEMNEYGDIDKDPVIFPEWRRELGEMMQTETQLFIESVMFDDGGSLADLLTDSHTFVNADLAELYGLEGTFDDQFVRVELDPTTRAGILTRLGFLTRNATLTDPDPIHRGVFANLNIICRPITALPSLPDDLNPVGNTNRERINSITGPGTCGERCHGTIINPIGFSLENYDAIGRYRTEDNGYPVDATGTYLFEDGREISFTNAIELSQGLAATPDVHSCYTGNLLEYMLGRELTAGDGQLLSYLTSTSLNEGRSIRDVMIDAVTSTTFRYRAAE